MIEHGAPIPGPSRIRALLRFPAAVADPLALGEEMVARWGRVSRFSALGESLVLLQDPELIHTLMHRHDADLVKDDVTLKLRRALGDGLLTAEGEKWRQHRRLIAPSLTPRHLDAYGDIMVERARALAAALPLGRRADLSQDLMGLTLDIVCRCLFGGDGAEAAAPIGAAMDGMQRRFWLEQHTWRRLLPEPALAVLREKDRHHVERLDRLLLALIAAHRERGDDGAPDLLGRLLAARDEDGAGFTDAELRDEAVTLFAAGAETTALALGYTLMLLGRHPAARDRLEAELDQALCGRAARMADLPQLPFLKAVIQESMRLYPPAWAIGRRLLRDLHLGPWQLRKGDTVLIMPWVLHHDPRSFPDPLAFQPQRWMDGLEKRLPRYAFMPFGAGARVCVGNHFAMLELSLVLATLLQSLRFAPEPDLVLNLQPSVTLRPGGPLPMKLSLRPVDSVSP